VGRALYNKAISDIDADKVDMDQCRLGQTDQEGSPIRKPTRWMSNAPHILKALDKQCLGKHGWCKQGAAWVKHRPCYGAVAKAAAIYPMKMCRAILAGFIEEMGA
jgi:hypothetical protein